MDKKIRARKILTIIATVVFVLTVVHKLFIGRYMSASEYYSHLGAPISFNMTVIFDMLVGACVVFYFKNDIFIKLIAIFNTIIFVFDHTAVELFHLIPGAYDCCHVYSYVYGKTLEEVFIPEPEIGLIIMFLGVLCGLVALWLEVKIKKEQKHPLQ